MKPKVYLAGGFYGDWQQKVKSEVKDYFIFFDPKDHGLSDSKQYTSWDLFHIAQSEIVFCFMSETNPSGYGLALEIGYAKALGKLIILVDEKSAKDNIFQKYFKMAHNSADAVFEDLKSGIEYLKKFNIQ